MQYFIDTNALIDLLGRNHGNVKHNGVNLIRRADGRVVKFLMK